MLDVCIQSDKTKWRIDLVFPGLHSTWGLHIDFNILPCSFVALAQDANGECDFYATALGGLGGLGCEDCEVLVNPKKDPEVLEIA